MENEIILQELDTLLKGSHMGVTTFTSLADQLQKSELKAQFHDYIKLFENHEKAITNAILFYHGQPDNQSLKTMMGEVMTSVKSMMLSSDCEVLQSAMKAIAMGKSQLKEFNDKNLALTEQLRKDVKIIHDDYTAIEAELHKASLECKED